MTEDEMQRMKKNLNNNCYIGIDPSVTKGKFAVCVIDEAKEIQFYIMKDCFLSFYKWIVELPDNVVVAVENSSLSKKLFWKYKDKKGNYYQKYKPGLIALSEKEKIAMAMNVGKNQQISRDTYFCCVAKWGNEKVLNLSPKQKGAKLNPLYVQQELKTTKKLTQDETDAWQLACHAKKYMRYPHLYSLIK